MSSLITWEADSLDASITPMEHKIWRKIGAFRAAELARPSMWYPKILGNPIMVVMFPNGKTP